MIVSSKFLMCYYEDKRRAPVYSWGQFTRCVVSLLSHSLVLIYGIHYLQVLRKLFLSLISFLQTIQDLPSSSFPHFWGKFVIRVRLIITVILIIVTVTIIITILMYTALDNIAVHYDVVTGLRPIVSWSITLWSGRVSLYFYITLVLWLWYRKSFSFQDAVIT